MITALGGLLLLGELDAISLSFGVVAPVVCAVVGAILLTRGLTRRA